MTCPCGCCDQEPSEDASLWVHLGAIVVGLILADLYRRPFGKREDASRDTG